MLNKRFRHCHMANQIGEMLILAGAGVRFVVLNRVMCGGELDIRYSCGDNLGTCPSCHQPMVLNRSELGVRPTATFQEIVVLLICRGLKYS